MSRYLLDTNIVSDLIRNPQGRIMEHIAEVGSETVAISVIVAAELRYGIQRRGSARLAAQLNIVLQGLPILPLKEGADHRYAQLRTQLERAGKPIGTNDMLIAAHALAIDATLVTDDIREFSRVEGLRVENWLRD